MGVKFIAILNGILYYQKKTNRKILEYLCIEPNNYILATVHRAENTDNPARLKAISQALDDAAGFTATVVLALHPRTRKSLSEKSIHLSKRIKVIEPTPYLETISLLRNAKAIITDSGGMQKEAFFLHTPCLTLRDETEWIETIACGANQLVGADTKKTAHAIEKLLSEEWKPDFSGKPYGQGNAANSIIKSLIKLLI